MLTSLLSLINKLVDIYILIIFVYIILSWLPNKRGFIADLDNALSKICDPYLNIFKKVIPPIGGMIDISPIIAIIALQLAVSVLDVLI